MINTKESVHIFEGQVIPSITITPTHMHLFMFSAITWNRHHIHYNKDAAISEGLPDVVVHRGLIGNYAVRMLDSWLSIKSELVSISWKVIKSATPNTPLECSGIVKNLLNEGRGKTISCDISISDPDSVVATGNATVRYLKTNN